MGFEVSGHPHINHDNPGANLAGDYVYPRPATEEIMNHLGGYILRPVAHLFCYYSVVTSHSDHSLLLDAGQRLGLNAGKLYGELFQPA